MYLIFIGHSLLLELGRISNFLHSIQDNHLPVTSSVTLLVATVDGAVKIIMSSSITLPSSIVLNSGM